MAIDFYTYKLCTRGIQNFNSENPIHQCILHQRAANAFALRMTHGPQSLSDHFKKQMDQCKAAETYYRNKALDATIQTRNNE